MRNTQKNINGFIPYGSIIIAYAIVKFINNITGFHYDISEGIFNMKFLIDITIWGCVYVIVYFLLSKLLPKRTSY
jgi:hypothetical protein